MERNGTIAAVATAPGRGGVAIVRVSGPDAFALAARICGRDPQPGRIRMARFRHPDDGTVLDAGVLLAFRAPHSYTGEDVVEFQCHGGTVTPRRILEACFAAGARLARRGEFTERAFLHGKLALDQATAVLDLVDAKTDRAADAALNEMPKDVPVFVDFPVFPSHFPLTSIIPSTYTITHILFKKKLIKKWILCCGNFTSFF